MSNLSNIGFPVKDEADLNILIEKIFPKLQQIDTEDGAYLLYSDKSGAQLWLQLQNNELIGLNPHFAGRSSREISIIKSVQRSGSSMDGGLYAWSSPSDPDRPDSGDYPFVFDVPDYYAQKFANFPHSTQVQLTAFPSEIQLFDTEAQYTQSQQREVKFASKSFIPTGMFNFAGGDADNPESQAGFTGQILTYELLKNHFTGERFYWFLVDTLSGNIDVVADPSLITKKPKTHGYLSGDFWLSGKLRMT